MRKRRWLGGFLWVGVFCAVGCSSNDSSTTTTRGRGGSGNGETGGTNGTGGNGGTGTTGGSVGTGGNGGTTGGNGGTTTGSGGTTGGSGGTTGGSGGTTGGSGGTTGGSGGTAGSGAGKADAGVTDTGTSTPDTSTVDARVADSSTGVDSRDAGTTPPTDSGGGGGPADGATPSPGCGSTATQSGTFTMMVAASGETRTYILKLPTTYNANTPYRTIFAWHHLTGNAAGIARGNYYGMDTAAYANGRAIFIAPEGSDTGNGELGWPDKNGVDMAFARQLLDWVKANLCVDTNRIFSTGWSYGGMFSEKLGCQLPNVFRAIAPMSAQLGGTGSCVKHNIAFWGSHGDMDATVSLASGIAARDYFLTLNHCTMTSAPTTPSPCIEYSGCDAGYPVHWCQFSGGHMTPSFATAGIWPFFFQF